MKLDFVSHPGKGCSVDGLTVYMVRGTAEEKSSRGGSRFIVNNPVSLGRWISGNGGVYDVVANPYQLFCAADFADYETAQVDVLERIKGLVDAGRAAAVGHYDGMTAYMTTDFQNWLNQFEYFLPEYIHDANRFTIQTFERLPLYAICPGQSLEVGKALQSPELVIESLFRGSCDMDDLEGAQKYAAKAAAQYVKEGIIKQVGFITPGGFDPWRGTNLAYTVEWTDDEAKQKMSDICYQDFYRWERAQSNRR